MKQRNVGIVVVAVCCVLAIAIAAGTLTETTQPGGSGGSVSNVNADGVTTETTTQPGQRVNQTTAQQQPPLRQDCPSRTLPWWAGVGLVAVTASVTIGSYRRYDGVVAVAMLLLMAVIVASVAPFFFICPSSDTPQTQQQGAPGDTPDDSGTGDGAGEGSGSGDDEQRQQPFDVPLLLLLGGAGILAVVLVGAWSVSGDDDDEDEVVEVSEDAAQADDAPVDTQAISTAAGRAADRIESSSDVDNEIYRAWVEMTRHLPVDHPETSTPREFERAAVDAGFDRADVQTLTDLFESVRYGAADATPEREARAVEALRRLEAHNEGETR
ncbi:DUF4129 domain-containing protein [Haloarchaeobius sp. DYHT-AS-18]|uniref:DUF4129 domain-containing protein n=1 Tax=Haloarchaeobius sp. DYHT-AS-18 TaxID=3446117 RepID=UPI003EB84C9F